MLVLFKTLCLLTSNDNEYQITVISNEIKILCPDLLLLYKSAFECLTSFVNPKILPTLVIFRNKVVLECKPLFQSIHGPEGENELDHDLNGAMHLERSSLFTTWGRGHNVLEFRG